MTGPVDLLGGEEAIEQVTLPIDSKAMEGLGKHHTLSSAIADLIDNSISADANAVLVRFLQSHGTVVGVQIVDNGKGMTPQGLRDGMTVGRRRDYRPDELGHFGMGLKASSLSQANVLSVWTRASNNDPTGMRMTKDSMMNGAQCDILSGSSALAHLYASDYGFDLTTGTVVQWSDVHGMSAADNLADQTRWFENALVALDQRARRLASMGRISTILSSSLDQDVVLNTAARLLVELFACDRCGIVLIDDQDGGAYLVAEYPATAYVGMRVPVEGDATFEQLIHSNKALAVYKPNAEVNSDSLQWLDAPATLLIPLIARDHVIGSISLDVTSRDHTFTDEEHAKQINKCILD